MTMRRPGRLAPPALALALLAAPATAQVFVQCPGDTNGDAVPEPGAPGYDPQVRCAHLTGGDGFVTMGDGTVRYMFGFSNVTGTPPAEVMPTGMLAAQWPAPTLEMDEGDRFYLTLTNVGMVMRPDLFDPHSVHFHGFPQAATIFDGVPEASVSINMGASLTYFYNIVEPGTYFYHCHVEATEHMQMGMLGNLFVRPAQDRTSPGLGGFSRFAYNDGDGSTGYDVAYPLQVGSFDGAFHDASLTVQPLPFAAMKDDYAMLNGRGYPDTTVPGALPAPAENGGRPSQVVGSLITAQAGQVILLRISNVSVTRFFTLATTGIPMRVVGHQARLLRGPTGTDLYYDTGSVTLGGGEALDVILDTAGLAPGTYLLYTTNLNYLSNGPEDFGGVMTEIVLEAPGEELAGAGPGSASR
jgi:FtsP/CotA-like multicopper oxidase with cupredoxin domain